MIDELLVSQDTATPEVGGGDESPAESPAEGGTEEAPKEGE